MELHFYLLPFGCCLLHLLFLPGCDLPWSPKCISDCPDAGGLERPQAMAESVTGTGASVCTACYLRMYSYSWRESQPSEHLPSVAALLLPRSHHRASSRWPSKMWQAPRCLFNMESSFPQHVDGTIIPLFVEKERMLCCSALYDYVSFPGLLPWGATNCVA